MKRRYKYLLLFCFLFLILAGCKEEKTTMHTPEQVGMSGSGMYYCPTEKGVYYYGDGWLYFASNSGESAALTPLAYADDEKVKDPLEISYDNYMDTFTGNQFVFFQNRLYFLMERMDSLGNLKYLVISLNEKGEDRKVEKELDFIPGRLSTTKDTLYVLNEDNTYLPLKGRGKEIPLPPNVDRLFFTEESVYALIPTDQQSNTLIQKWNGEEWDNVRQAEGSVTYMTDKLAALSKMERGEEGSLKGGKITSYLLDLETGEQTVELEDQAVTYLGEDFFCTQTLVGHRIYRKYSLEGKLLSELEPAKLLKENKRDEVYGEVDFWGMDFVDDKQVIASYKEDSIRKVASFSWEDQSVTKLSSGL